MVSKTDRSDGFFGYVMYPSLYISINYYLVTFLPAPVIIDKSDDFFWQVLCLRFDLNTPLLLHDDGLLSTVHFGMK